MSTRGSANDRAMYGLLPRRGITLSYHMVHTHLRLSVLLTEYTPERLEFWGRFKREGDSHRFVEEGCRMANAVRPETDGISVTDETLLSRWRFLELCVVSMAGLSLLVLAGCGGSQDGGGNGNGNGEKDNEEDDGGGGGGGGGGY
jgi:hypothetical protein